MKKGMSVGKKIMGGIVSILFLSAIVIRCNDDDNANANNNPYAVNGIANGDQMVPDTVKESGSSTITGSYDPVTGQMIFTTNWANLTGTPIGGGIYNGAAGTVGTPVDTTWFADSLIVNPLSGRLDTMVLTTDQANQLIAGTWYYLLKTHKYPDGEVRGQMTAVR